MANFNTFEFVANTLDGKILEFPLPVQMRCDLVIPLYQDIVKAYDKSECIVARKVYLVSYVGHLYGTFDFTTLEEFVEYRDSKCVCRLSYNGCIITFNGRPIFLN